jgi:hypothetical protein
MIPAEARNVIDTLGSIKHTEDNVLDAIDCLNRVVSPSQRDRNRVQVAISYLAGMKETEGANNV